MFLVIFESFFPLVLLSIIGGIMLLFPWVVLNIKNFDASMMGSLFRNDLSFRKSALWSMRIVGVIFIGSGIYIFLLVNGLLV